MRILVALFVATIAIGALSIAQAQDVPQVDLDQEETLTVSPKVVKVDSDFDGKIDRTEYYNDEGKVERVELDRSGDGKIDEWVTYKDGKPFASERDTNADGKPDIWLDY